MGYAKYAEDIWEEIEDRREEKVRNSRRTAKDKNKKTKLHNAKQTASQISEVE